MQHKYFCHKHKVMKKHLLIPILFTLISCQKDLTIDPPINPPDPIKNAKKILILDSIVYTNTPASTCTGCPYIVFKKISYSYNADDKVDRTIGVQNKTNGVFFLIRVFLR